jgi:hypothetical protein
MFAPKKDYRSHFICEEVSKMENTTGGWQGPCKGLVLFCFIIRAAMGALQ